MKRLKYVIVAMAMAVLILFTGCSGDKQKQTKEKSSEDKNAESIRVEGSYDDELEEIVGDSFFYRIEDGIAVLSGIYQYRESEEIPDILQYEGKDYPIEKIGENAFQDDSVLRLITLPEGMKEIGSNAFYDCDNIEEIVIPDSVKKYGDGIFFNCERLQKAVLGNGLEGIPDEMFSNCYALTEVEYPQGIKYIGKEALWACESLKSFTISGDIVTVGDRAFYASAIETMDIKAESLKISDDIFEGMDKLQELTVPTEYEKDYKALENLSQVSINGQKQEE
ncbi:MAG: leucine-rich repeat domain-containing protein [Lachnospiraceae bacterium]|nr:leucine-rich repeat domain-containing protein [Lachnospiraceae bacterium]